MDTDGFRRQYIVSVGNFPYQSFSMFTGSVTVWRKIWLLSQIFPLFPQFSFYIFCLTYCFGLHQKTQRWIKISLFCMKVSKKATNLWFTQNCQCEKSSSKVEMRINFNHNKREMIQRKKYTRFCFDGGLAVIKLPDRFNPWGVNMNLMLSVRSFKRKKDCIHLQPQNVIMQSNSLRGCDVCLQSSHIFAKNNMVMNKVGRWEWLCEVRRSKINNSVRLFLLDFPVWWGIRC